MTAFEYITLKHENEMLLNQIKSLKQKLKDLENLDVDTIELAGYKRGVKETIDKACKVAEDMGFDGVAEQIRKAMKEE